MVSQRMNACLFDAALSPLSWTSLYPFSFSLLPFLSRSFSSNYRHVSIALRSVVLDLSQKLAYHLAFNSTSIFSNFSPPSISTSDSSFARLRTSSHSTSFWFLITHALNFLEFIFLQKLMLLWAPEPAWRLWRTFIFLSSNNYPDKILLCRKLPKPPSENKCRGWVHRNWRGKTHPTFEAAWWWQSAKVNFPCVPKTRRSYIGPLQSDNLLSQRRSRATQNEDQEPRKRKRKYSQARGKLA